MNYYFFTESALGSKQKVTFQDLTPQLYAENNKIIIEPVPLLDLLFKNIEDEAKSKGYTREELEHEIEVVREKLMKDLYE